VLHERSTRIASHKSRYNFQSRDVAGAPDTCDRSKVAIVGWGWQMPVVRMPELCRFYGLRIMMNYADHVPPHFHATYGDDEAQVEIGIGEIIGGSLPRRAAALVKEWAALHCTELEENWRRREQSLPLNKIEPLP